MKKLNFKKHLSYFPEAAILLVALYWFINDLIFSPSYVNYYMIGLAVLILSTVIWRIKAFAVMLSAVLGIGSFYMILAVFSEFTEFHQGDPESIQLLVVGLLIFIPLAAMAVLLPIKYFSSKAENSSN